MKWKDLSLKERKQIYDSVRANNPDATYFDIKEQFDSIPTYEDGKGKTIFNNGRIPTNVSVDRIDSKKGYTRDNVQLVCMAINQMKSDLDNNTFYNLCKAVYKNAAKWKH